ncbi:MAG: efflux RND transporter periplasmic adaptor subunit [Deltaproteobacteria bacterium]|nr:efflux RND transporter periplasmic adaptor subunit [Deltaproteobacteria bacterium]
MIIKKIPVWTQRRKMIDLCVKPAITATLVAALLIITWAVPSGYGEEQFSVSGVTEPIKDITLSTSVAGRISTIFVKEGDRVKKGDCLLTLDKRLEELEVKRRKLIWESKAEVNAAFEKVTTLKSLLESTRKLFESTKSVSEEELQKKELEYKVQVEELHRLEIAEKREKIEYEMALEQLRKRSLRSPIDGIITEVLLDEGESCEERQPLIHVVDTGKCLLVCNVEEKVGRTLRKGQSVDLKIQTGSKFVPKKGTIIFVSPVVDPASSLLVVKARFENRDGKVRPGVGGAMLLTAP